VKTIPIALLAEIESGGSRLAFGLTLTRRDGDVICFTSADQDAFIGGRQYLSAPGLDIDNLVSSAGFAADNSEIRVLPDDAYITKTDVLAGKWDGAEFELFRYNWADTSDGVETIKRGTLGNMQPRRGVYTAELRSIRQALQQTVGSIVQPTCRYRLGSTAKPDGLCMVDLGPFTVTGAVGVVVSQYEFTDAARTEADAWFAEGVLTWLTGLNAGLSQKVRASLATGRITLSLPMLYEIGAGDTYSMHAGCRKRHEEDCRDKFDNVPNFGGEPHLPGQDHLTAPAAFST
jgi:uncharacterized phage protein (TIGR02218 family)